MTIHTYLIDLPDVLEALGYNVEVADGYELGQGNYLWTNPHTGAGSYDGKPYGYMVHHSASSSATPPPHDTSKASAWIGLKRGDRLYQEGGGVPTIYLASAGPARVSSGYGYRPAAWDYTFEQKRAPARAQGSDGDTALNRYSFNMETVHRGDGSAIDPGVLEHVIGLGIALEQMCGLSEMTLGHRSWSQRKIDPYWNNDTDCITQVQEAVAQKQESGMWADDWTDKSWMTFFDWTDIPGINGAGRYYCSNDGTVEWPADEPWGSGPANQPDGGANYSEKVHAINYVFSGLAIAVGGPAE